MYWIIFSGLICMCALVILIFALVCCLRLMGHDIGGAAAAAKKVPGIQNYISSVSREQNVNDWEDNACCAICMEPFGVDGEMVAELSCSKKHIFHTTCL